MPGSISVEDPFVGHQAATHGVSAIEDCSIAVDATHFIQQMLDQSPSHEPLLCALAGLTGIHMHMENELNQWKAHKVTPLFVFDGQPLVGQYEMTVASGLRDIRRTSEAWELYFDGRANEAVAAFGVTGLGKATFPPQTLYPLLQRLLKKRKLHFIVAPYNASAQIAAFDMVGSDQCAGIMGSLELLLYPIHDCVITALDWTAKCVHAVSKRQLVSNLGVSESMFIDAFLMTGTSFLPIFPPLRDATVNPRQPSVVDASNLLRIGNKNIETVCSNFADIVKVQDPKWLDKFYKARMVVDHFIYIAESGEVKVNGHDKLTKDHHAYLGFQLPPELFYYLDKGLVGPRILTWLTYSQVNVPPTVDGFVSDEYRNLVTKQLAPTYADALCVVYPCLNRAFSHPNLELNVWFDSAFSTVIAHDDGVDITSRIRRWHMTEDVFGKYFAKPASGTLAFELGALSNKEFVSSLPAKTRGLDSADAIVSLTWWRLLSLRGFIDAKTLELTKWGVALAKTFAALEPVVKRYPEFTTLNAAAYLAFELIRLDLLNSKNQHAELQGFPANGSEEARNAVVLISRVATLLQMRQDTSGYTGPLSKNLLAFHTLITTVGDAIRANIDGLLARLFMSGGVNRDRSDYWEIGHRLPFTEYPDAALGIAVKTFLDESFQDDTEEAKAERKTTFPPKFVPHATHLFDDFDVAFGLVDALSVGVESLDNSLLKAEDKADWARAKKYLAQRK